MGDPRNSGSPTKSANITMWKRENGNNVSGQLRPKRLQLRFDGVTGSEDIILTVPAIFKQYTDVWFSAASTAQTASISIDFELMLINQDYAL